MRRLILWGVLWGMMVFSGNARAEEAEKEVPLPQPERTGTMTVEEAIFARRSVRDFENSPLSLEEVSRILWAAGGVTVDGMTGPTRAYPSAGAVYPLEIYLVAGNVIGLPAGIYKYEWRRHVLVTVKKGDFREALSKAALSQKMVKDAPATIVVTAQYEKTASRYGQRGTLRYVAMDTGHMGQNVHLEAESLGLGTTMVGAFIDPQVVKILGTEKKELPVYMMPVGRPSRK
ncbi:MAG: SagB/ThcOx family dehydrogenase [Candidatus Omnitrophota bacterium]